MHSSPSPTSVPSRMSSKSLVFCRMSKLRQRWRYFLPASTQNLDQVSRNSGVIRGDQRVRAASCSSTPGATNAVDIAEQKGAHLLWVAKRKEWKG